MILDAVTRWDKEGSDCAPVASSPSPAAESAVLSDEVNGNDRKHLFCRSNNQENKRITVTCIIFS